MFAKSSFLNIWQGLKYTPGQYISAKSWSIQAESLAIEFFLVRLQDFGMKSFLEKTSISDICVNSPFFVEYLFYGTVIMELQVH